MPCTSPHDRQRPINNIHLNEVAEGSGVWAHCKARFSRTKMSKIDFFSMFHNFSFVVFLKSSKLANMTEGSAMFIVDLAIHFIGPDFITRTSKCPKTTRTKHNTASQDGNESTQGPCHTTDMLNRDPSGSRWKRRPLSHGILIDGLGGNHQSVIRRRWWIIRDRAGVFNIRTTWLVVQRHIVVVIQWGGIVRDHSRCDHGNVIIDSVIIGVRCSIVGLLVGGDNVINSFSRRALSLHCYILYRHSGCV